MKSILTLSLLFYSLITAAQVVTVTEYSSHADVSVHVLDSDSSAFADCKIHIQEYESSATKKVYLEESASHADKKVVLTEYYSNVSPENCLDK
jgi:hypothetical protein